MRATDEFNKNLLAARLICAKYEFKSFIIKSAKTLLGRNKPKVFEMKSRFTEREAKKIIVRQGIAVVDGSPSWFYKVFERDDRDPLTNFALNFIAENVSKNSEILVTGCGTGIMPFHLCELGFESIEAFDLMDETIETSNILKEKFNYDQVIFRVDDGFSPTLTKKYDLITALHWVFSAWMGNYGNDPAVNPYNSLQREKLLKDFLSKYAPHLKPGGIMILELVDAVADYREPYDHYLGPKSKEIYPVRHTPQQVEKLAHEMNLSIIDKRFCMSYMHQPRTSYLLKKMS